ncbi:MAG TPA: hypothetical protein VG106_15335, partial [Vicinamibacterales bacterium]|nr:hypothetical protein [Vicinamibacterales bacterium]
MPLILADRFVALGSRWIDLATAEPVRLRILPAGSRVQQAIWAEDCATLARLRHPLLNPLIDYGALNESRLFEAYLVRPPVSCAGPAASRLLVHVTRFLEVQGVQLTRSMADFAVRAVAEPAGRQARTAAILGRPIGIVLQPRRVLEHLAEMLDAEAGPPICVDVCGGVGSGLTTLHTLAARAARLCGYAPLSASALTSLPWVGDAFLERHACILTNEDASARARAAVARLLARLGVA